VYISSRVDHRILIVRTKDGKLVRKSDAYSIMVHGGATNTLTGDLFIFDYDYGYQIKSNFSIVKTWKPAIDKDVKNYAMELNNEK
jgi:hypothetical protein